MQDGTRYGNAAIAFHWLTVLLLVGSFSIGFYMEDLPVSPTRLKLFAYHKWIGVTIFALVALRLTWRYISPPPPLPLTMPAWERTAAQVSHWLLYALLFAVPLSGWLMSSAKGFQTVWFGVIPIPDLLDKNKELGEALTHVHHLLAKGFLALIALHALAALKHHYRDRDNVLARMTPGIKPRPSA
jgi:cytochrome b561